MDADKEDAIRDQVLQTLFDNYKTGRPNQLMLTIDMIWMGVRKIIPCRREDINRVVSFLETYKWITPKTETLHFAKTKYSSRTSHTNTRYKLSTKGLDLFEQKGKYNQHDLSWKSKLNVLNITDSNIYGTIGQGENVHIETNNNWTEQIQNILNKIDEHTGLPEDERNKAKEIINTELPDILKEATVPKGKQFLQKMKEIGLSFLIQVTAQLVANAIGAKIGIPPSQQQFLIDTLIV